jgi:uncharacterized protein
MTTQRRDDAETAIYRNDVGRLAALLTDGLDADSRDADGRTLLMLAVLSSDASIEVVSTLLSHNADVNARDSDQQWTPLHFAARDQRADLVKALLEAGAVVDATDSFGNTPLWRSVMSFRGDSAAIELLMASGADPLRPNSRGISAAQVARSRPELAAIVSRD